MGRVQVLSTKILSPEEAYPIVIEALSKCNRLVVCAPTGWGKSTLIPQWIADRFGGKVLVTEPRRVAARTLAAYVAQARGGKVGGEVGYMVRFDTENAGSLICYVTEGILLRMLQDDPVLSEVSAVCIDEFHERHLFSDIALGLLVRLTETKRPDLRIVVLSATIDGTRVADWLDGSLVDLGSSVIQETPDGQRVWNGRFHVDILYRPGADLADVIREIEAIDPGREGAILVFLPGKGEIAEAHNLLATEFGDALWIVPLHAEQDAAEQDVAFMPPPPGRRKVVLATNVAETSVTVPDVQFVVDLGWERMAEVRPPGFRTLSLRRISKTSATQRAGRAGRTGPGLVIRLWHPSEPIPDATPPEILREDLVDVLLMLLATGIRHPEEIPVLDAPPLERWEEAWHTLQALGAVDEKGELTPLGREMASLPLAPRLARIVLEAVGGPELDVVLRAVAVAAVERPVLLPLPSDPWEANLVDRARRTLFRMARDWGSDLLLGAAILERWMAGRRSDLEGMRVRMRTLEEAAMIYEQIVTTLKEQAGISVRPGAPLPERVRRAIAVGLADRLIVHWAGNTYVGPGNHRVLVGRESVFHAGPEGPLPDEREAHHPAFLAPWEIREIRSRRGTEVRIATGNTMCERGWALEIIPCHLLRLEVSAVGWLEEPTLRVRKTLWGVAIAEEFVHAPPEVLEMARALDPSARWEAIKAWADVVESRIGMLPVDEGEICQVWAWYAEIARGVAGQGHGVVESEE